MLFPTLTFGLFFLVVYAAAWSVRASNEWRKIILLIASWYFYGAWDTRTTLHGVTTMLGGVPGGGKA